MNNRTKLLQFDKAMADAIFVRDNISKNSIAPSFTEIRDGCGIKSTETVRRYLLKLEDEGYIKIKKIETVNMVARGIVVLK